MNTENRVVLENKIKDTQGDINFLVESVSSENRVLANISVRKQEIIDKTPEKYKQRVIKLLDKIEEKMVNHIAKQKKKSIDLVKDFGYEQQRVSELDVNMFSSHRNSELSDEISWKNNRLGFMPESVFYDGEIKIARDSSIGVDTRLMIAQLIYDFNESNSVQTETIKSVIRANLEIEKNRLNIELEYAELQKERAIYTVYEPVVENESFEYSYESVEYDGESVAYDKPENMALLSDQYSGFKQNQETSSLVGSSSEREVVCLGRTPLCGVTH